MPRDNRCMYMTHVCFYVCCSDCGNVSCVAAVVKISVLPWSVAVCLCRACDACCHFCMYCVHPVAVLNAAFCVTCSLLMLV